MVVAYKKIEIQARKKNTATKMIKNKAGMRNCKENSVTFLFREVGSIPNGIGYRIYDGFNKFMQIGSFGKCASFDRATCHAHPIHHPIPFEKTPSPQGIPHRHPTDVFFLIHLPRHGCLVKVSLCLAERCVVAKLLIIPLSFWHCLFPRRQCNK